MLAYTKTKMNVAGTTIIVQTTQVIQQSLGITLSFPLYIILPITRVFLLICIWMGEGDKSRWDTLSRYDGYESYIIDNFKLIQLSYLICLFSNFYIDSFNRGSSLKSISDSCTVFFSLESVFKLLSSSEIFCLLYSTWSNLLFIFAMLFLSS